MSHWAFKLAAHFYPCSAAQPTSEDIVLLHGWGTNSSSWQPLIFDLQKIGNVIALDLPGFGGSEQIPEFNLETVSLLISQHLPKKCVLVGWSLGGMLAVKIAVRYPHIVTKVISLAANVKFVACENFQAAMPLLTNQQFNQGFSTDASATLKLFSGLLAQGDVNERALLKKVRPLIQSGSVNANWLEALEVLAQIDNRQDFSTLSQQGLHLLGEKDALVPVDAGRHMLKLNNKQHVEIIKNAAHAVHWSNPELVSHLITDFLKGPSSSLDKVQVANSFSRAANTYDSVASLQRYAGKQLLEYVHHAEDVNVVLDLGCGTGYFTPQLQKLFPSAQVVGVDIAEGMLRFAHEHHSSQNNWLCADADFLPLADNSVDIIFSNFALQWCTDLSHLFAEINRVLKPSGQCIFSSLGPATLYELKKAWSQVDGNVHVNYFHDKEFLLENLKRNNFEVLHFDNKLDVMEFDNLSDLTRSLKCLGAQNMNSGRATGLTGRKKIEAFRDAYEIYRENNVLPATYDIFYLKVKK